jgi:hypothetical protein
MRKTFVFLGLSLLVAGFVAGCSNNKQEIPLSPGQTYLLQSSGKLAVFASQAADGAKGSQPLAKLRVKRKNEGSAAKSPGCWACTDCICNGDECACTECTSC